MPGRIGEGLLDDAIDGRPRRGRYRAEVAVDGQRDVRARPTELLDQPREVVEAGHGRGDRGCGVLGRGLPQEPHGGADLGEALAAEPFGLGKRPGGVLRDRARRRGGRW